MVDLLAQIDLGVPVKRCSENMLQIYSRTPMRKCDFKKVAKQLYLICCIFSEHLFDTLLEHGDLFM